MKYNDNLRLEVIDLAYSNLEWLEKFSKRNKGVDRLLDKEINSLEEELNEYIKEYSTKKINFRCTKKALERLNTNLYCELVNKVMEIHLREYLSNYLVKDSFYTDAICPYLTPEGRYNRFDFNFNNFIVSGEVWYYSQEELDERRVKYVVMNMSDKESYINIEKHIPKVCNSSLVYMCLFRKDTYWYCVEDFVEADFDKGIDKIKAKIQELGEGKYKWFLSLNNEVLYIHLNIKEDRLEVRVFTSEDEAHLKSEIIKRLKENGEK